jgi:hypothetical protein
MSKENPLWGAARIHGELLMLGFEVAQSTVSKYMVRRRNPPSQTWKTFLRNHAEAIAAIDLCVVPTLTFDRLFAFLVLGHGRRQLLWIEVTRRPTAEWLARQITEAFPWTSAPAYLVRDNDRAYLRACLYVPRQGHGYPRPADLAWIAVAKWLCGTPDRHRARNRPIENTAAYRIAVSIIARNLIAASSGRCAELLSLRNVRFRGKSGHHADTRSCPLLTQSGHRRLPANFRFHGLV